MSIFNVVYAGTWGSGTQYNLGTVQGQPDTVELPWVVYTGATYLAIATPPINVDPVTAGTGFWIKMSVTSGDGIGTVTSVSVVTANGLGGTVATATTTPAITLTTSVTGIVKGNGTALSAAVAGTDYVVPSGSITGNAATATNITGGLAGQVLYQSGPNVTARLANGTGFLHNDGSGTLVWQPESGLGTVTNFIFTNGNGIAGVVGTSTTTPTLSLTTTVTGIVKGNGTAFSAAVSGTDYSAGTNALATGIVKSTTSTGVLSIAVAGTDYVIPSGSITGNAATATNIQGGTANQIAFQSGAGLTSFIGTANNSILATDGSGVPAFTAVLPAINIGAGLATDPTTSSTNNINSILSNLNIKIESGVHPLGANAVAIVNINISNPGTSIFDGTTVTSGQSVLLPAQSTNTENGLYIFNGPSSAMTRSTFMNTWDEVQGALVVVPASTTYTNGSSWLSTVTSGGTIGTTPITFSLLPGGQGTVTNVAGTNANGFIFNISNPTSTPNITLSTSFTGIAYSNGTGLAAAIASNFPTLNQDTSGNAATATLAASATSLATSRNIYGSPFNGTANVVGPVGVGFGGSGATTLAANGILLGAGTSPITATTLTNGQLLIGSTGAAPVATTLTAGAGMVITNAAGSITLRSTGAGGGLAPYNIADSYTKGNFISGDGTNNVLGGIFTANTATGAGSYDSADWSTLVALDLTDVTKVSCYVGTVVIPATTGLGLNTFFGPNIAATPTISGTGICGAGVNAFQSSAGISGNYLTGFGGRVFGSGNLTSATQIVAMGYQAAFAATTATSGVWLGYQAGMNLTTDEGTIILGSYAGTAGVDANKFIAANPENGTVFINITGTDILPVANLVLATPNGSAGAANLRALVAADIPTLNQNTTGNAATATALAGNLTNHLVLLGAGTGIPGTVVGTGTAGQVLKSNGVGADPTWQNDSVGSGTVTNFIFTDGSGFVGTVGTSTTTPTLALTTSVSGIIKGSTGALVAAVSGTDYVIPSGNVATATALATPRAIYGNNFDGTAALTQIITSPFGGTGNGFTKFAGATTSEKTYTLPDASCNILTDNTAVTVPQGGTGAITLTNHGILLGQATGAIVATAALTNGQVLVGSTGADPVPATITQGAGISITNGAGTITIAATGSSLARQNVTGTTQTMVANTIYTCNNAGQITFALPATAAVGDIIQVKGNGAGGWIITQGAGQVINGSSGSTTLGASGTLTSSNQYDCVSLTCMIANTAYTVDTVTGTPARV